MHIFADTQRVANIKGSETNFYHTDHLGSSSVITKEDGSSVQALYYYPYGEIHSNIGIDVTRYKFTGQEWDAETDLYYYGARYYDPKLARFISADTIVPMPFYPISLNRYAYCYNNPVILRDLDGHEGEWYDDGYLDFLFNSDSGSNNSSDNFWNWGSGGGSSSGGSGYSGSNNTPYYIFRNSPSVISTSSNSYRSNSTSSVSIGSSNVASPTSVIGGGGGGSGSAGYDMYAAYDNGTAKATDAGQPLTAGEKALNEAFRYAGDKGINCNELVIFAYQGAGYDTNYVNTKNIDSSPYFRALKTDEAPRTGDLVVWPDKHMGLFVSPSLGYKTDTKLTANIFHAPGANSLHLVGFSNINFIFSQRPTYYRYRGE
jgi:RHS repeat-associated protein